MELSSFDHDAYYKRAQAHLEIGRVSSALDDLKSAINIAPTNTKYLYLRGLVSLESGEFQRALLDFDSAISITNNCGPQTISRAGEMYKMHASPSQYVGLRCGWEDADFVNPLFARSFLDLGRTYAQLGGLEQAITNTNQAVEILKNRFNTPEWDLAKPMINDQLAETHQFLGDVYAKLGKETEAQREYRLSSGLR